MLRYTLLRLTDGGIVLCGFHLGRLGLSKGEDRYKSFCRTARQSSEGVYAVKVTDSSIQWRLRPGSRLFDGMPARFLPSPVLGERGRFAKPPPPAHYDSVRQDGVATLLTSADGSEIYEACSAAVLGWDGSSIVCAPSNRPRVDSLSERAVRSRFNSRDIPIPASGMPILLINAVKGTCSLSLPGRDGFPQSLREEIDRLISETTVFPS